MHIYEQVYIQIYITMHTFFLAIHYKIGLKPQIDVKSTQNIITINQVKIITCMTNHIVIKHVCM